MFTVTLDRHKLVDLIKKVTGRIPDDVLVIDEMFKHTTASTAEAIEEKIAVLTTSINDYKVVGVTFEGRQDQLKQLKINDELTFVPDPTNKYDPNAVAVQCPAGTQIGFLPKDFAAIVKDVVPFLTGKITAVLGSTQSSLGIRFKFFRKQDVAPCVTINLDAINVQIEKLPTDAIETGKKDLEKVYAEAETATAPKPVKRGPRKKAVPPVAETPVVATESPAASIPNAPAPIEQKPLIQEIPAELPKAEAPQPAPEAKKETTANTPTPITYSEEDIF